MRRGRAPHFAMLLSLDSTGQTLGGAVLRVWCDTEFENCTNWDRRASSAGVCTRTLDAGLSAPAQGVSGFLRCGVRLKSNRTFPEDHPATRGGAGSATGLL